MDGRGKDEVQSMNHESLTVVSGAVMHDELTEYTRCVENADGWNFEVATIGWENPYTPKRAWHVVQSWQTRPSDEDLAKVRDEVFSDPRYFRHCKRCDRHFCTGHMHNSDTCQGCAERYLGVVH